MNPQEIFCPNMDCPARGQTGKGNIHVHGQQDKRYICDVCEQTFSASKGTIFYRLRSDPKMVMWVIVLLAYGYPIQAIVKAFELDERAVRDWQQRAGKHCQNAHEHWARAVNWSYNKFKPMKSRSKLRKGRSGWRWH